MRTKMYALIFYHTLVFNQGCLLLTFCFRTVLTRFFLVQSQLTEMNSIKQQLFEFERSFQSMKHHYEEEILRLRRQLENSGRTSTPPNEPRMGSAFTAQNLNLTSSLDKKMHMEVEPDRVNGKFSLSAPTLGNKHTPSNVKPSSSSLKPLSPNVSTAPGTNEVDVSKKSRPSEISNSSGDNIVKDWIVGINNDVEMENKLDIDLNFDLEHDSVVCCVKFSTDGQYLATGCNKKTQIFDVTTGKKVNEFMDCNLTDESSYVRSVMFDPTGRYLATGAEDRKIRVWDIAKRSLVHSLSGHGLDIYSLDYSSDGKFLVSGSGDKTVKIWDATTGKCLSTLGHNEITDGVTSVAYSPDGRTVAAGSLDKIVRIWDIEKQQIIEKFQGHKDAVYSVAFDPQGKSLVSGSLDKKLKLWDLGRSGKSKNHHTFTGHKDYVLSVAFSPDGQWLVSGSKDRCVHFWDPRTVSLNMMLHGHQNSVISVSLSGSDRIGEGKFATGSGDSRARIWSFKNIVK